MPSSANWSIDASDVGVGDTAVSFPSVEIVEESMREGMQIESADIPVEAKLELLDALGETGLRTIVVGSFVSPRWTPQMACVDELVSRMRPRAGVRYTALAMNPRGVERMSAHMPPLEPSPGVPRTIVHLCDVFVRRNTNRSQEEEIAAWPTVIAAAQENDATEAEVAINAAWGSNWLGDFSHEYRVQMIQRQMDLWSAAGIPVTRLWIGDPMAWNLPNAVELMMSEVVDRWPTVRTVHLHLHDARGSALTSAYAALRTLTAEHTLVLDSSVGGMGGCPYGGHGRMTKMIPTEDLVDLLNELGIVTGVHLDRLIEVAQLAEGVVGHQLYGHVSKAGPRPRGPRRYAMDMPFVETEQQAQHFRLGPSVYAGAPSPWKKRIASPMRVES
jgi:hydroxymethylglutaryl-CoA lyase